MIAFQIRIFAVKKGSVGMLEFLVYIDSLKKNANRFNDIADTINSVKSEITSIGQNINHIGLNDIKAHLDLIESALIIHKNKVDTLHTTLNSIIDRYLCAEETITSKIGSSTNLAAVAGCSNSGNKGVVTVESYDLEKVKELMQKKPEDLSEEELIYLMNAILQLDADGMDEFMLASLVGKPRVEEYLLMGSDNAFAAMLLCKYELYDQLINNEITEDEYISQTMKIIMLENVLSKDYFAKELENFTYKFFQDPNDDDMFDSGNPASWTEEIGSYYHAMWKFKFDWQQTVRYMGDGSTANIVTDVNSRYDAVRENSFLNVLIKNTTETLLLAGVSSNPAAAGAASIGYGTINDILDSSGGDRDMSDMINSFDLNVIETETAKGQTHRTKTEYTIVPGTDTQEGVDKFNSQIDNLRGDYIDTYNKITLKGASRAEVVRIANSNEYITLGTDANFNLYVTDIQEITVYDIINCPNKVNELYYVVNLLEN